MASTCNHSLSNITGYRLMQTDWTGGHPCKRTVVAEFGGATSYVTAMAAARMLRTNCTPTQYAVVDSIYVCGCQGQG